MDTIPYATYDNTPLYPQMKNDLINTYQNIFSEDCFVIPGVTIAMLNGIYNPSPDTLINFI